MGRDPNEIYNEQRRQNLEQKHQKSHGTLETVGLEQNRATNRLYGAQAYIVYGLAVIGALAVAYIVLSAIF